MIQGFLSVLSYVKSKLKVDAGSFCAVVQHQRHLAFLCLNNVEMTVPCLVYT